MHATFENGTETSLQAMTDNIYLENDKKNCPNKCGCGHM